MYHILCVDDNESFLFGLKTQLAPHYRVFTARSEVLALEVLKTEQIDLMLLDVNLTTKNDGIELISKFKQAYPSLSIIMLSGLRDPELIVEAMKFGAADYICKPYPMKELIAVIEKNLATRHTLEKNAALIELFNHEQVDNSKLIGASEVMEKLRQQIARVKGHGATILIEGESGTGKEVAAKYIHSLELNPARPFIAINCAAIPENLLESELFGHERGAFTGADRRKLGKFELAGGGDLFLDEINSLKPEMQAKLLRVLQDKTFYRVGGVAPIQINARVIAASNAGLDQEVEKGKFRHDLLYRLRVISFKMAPLRERKTDIVELIDFLVKKHFGSKPVRFSADVMAALQEYNWPGNVRELENLIQSLVIMATATEITLNDMPEWIVKSRAEKVIQHYTRLPAATHGDIAMSLKEYTRVMEIEFIKRTVESHAGNVNDAARELGISKSKLYWTLNKDPRRETYAQ